jgi:D-serine deaminase-like pyridoxal phosphate-dependent protein
VETRQQVRDLVTTIRSCGLNVPRIVVGGSGSFHFWLEQSREDPIVEGSPGTFVFSDWNYHQRYPDYQMQPAAVVLTRVISKPRPGRLTLDAGHKAVAADKPAADRLWFFELSRWEILRHNEEHLVLDTPDGDRFELGDVLYALPYHVCPTIALYRELNVVEDGKVSGTWRVAARDRT